MKKNGSLHLGINMSKIPVGAGFAGVVFTVGSLMIFLVGIPALWYFVALALAVGLGIAAILRAAHR